MEPKPEGLLRSRASLARSWPPRPWKISKQPGKNWKGKLDQPTLQPVAALFRLVARLLLLAALIIALWGDPAPQRKELHQPWGKPGFSMLYFNVTLFGRKAMSLLAEMDPDSKPDAIELVEVHLRGTDLNAARRKVKQLGWRMLATPAIIKAELRAAAAEQPRDGPPEQVEHEEIDEARSAKFHNSGG